MSKIFGFVKYCFYLCREKIVTMGKERIKYINRIDSLEQYNYPRYGYKSVETDFVKRYYNVFAILAGLNPCCRDLMDYLTEVMDEDNVVRSDEYSRQNFLQVLKEQTLQTNGEFVEYSDSNIKKAFQVLTDRKCLIKLNKGLYKVNPEIYFKKNNRKRLEAIKFTLEFQKGVRNTDMELLYEVNEATEEYGENKIEYPLTPDECIEPKSE